MHQEQISVQRASRNELAEFAQWYRFVESAVNIDSDDVINTCRLDAYDSGVLGAALDLADEDDIRRAFNDVAALGDSSGVLPRHQLARTLVLTARMGSQTVGILESGPPTVLALQVLERLGSTRAEPAMIRKAHMDMTVRVAKLNIVAVLPGMRGVGIGHALVTAALDIAGRSATRQMYGQFDSSTPELTHFYSDLGFTVKESGSPLRLFGGWQIQSRPTERMIYANVGPIQS